MQLLHKAGLIAPGSCTGFGSNGLYKMLGVLYMSTSCLVSVSACHVFGHVLCIILHMLDLDPAVAGNHICRILGILLTVACKLWYLSAAVTGQFWYL